MRNPSIGMGALVFALAVLVVWLGCVTTKTIDPITGAVVETRASDPRVVAAAERVALELARQWVVARDRYEDPGCRFQTACATAVEDVGGIVVAGIRDILGGLSPPAAADVKSKLPAAVVARVESRP